MIDPVRIKGDRDREKVFSFLSIPILLYSPETLTVLSPLNLLAQLRQIHTMPAATSTQSAIRVVSMFNKLKDGGEYRRSMEADCREATL